MNKKCLINCLSYLEINDLIKLFINNKVYLNYFFTDMIKKNFILNKLKIENINITNFINYVPLPSYLKFRYGLNLNIKNNYKSDSKNNNIIMQSNLCLPHSSTSPIPFTFGFIKKDKYNLVNSNVYYFEVKLNKCKYNLNDDFFISLGFGSINNCITNKIVGNQNNSIGLNSINGELVINNSKFGIKMCDKIRLGDVIGAGLIYTRHEYYIPFFTLNGKMLRDIREIILTGLITPQISVNNLPDFNLNFGQKKFLFKIEKIINNCNSIISTKNIFLIKNYDIKIFKFITKRSKILSPSYIPIPTSNLEINNFINNITNNAINMLSSPINTNYTENITNLPFNYDESITADDEEIIEENYEEEILQETPLLTFSDNIINFFENNNL